MKRKPRTVISFQAMPRRVPWQGTAVLILLCRVYSAPLVVRIIAYVIIALVWALYIYDLIKYSEQPLNIFEDGDNLVQ